MRNEPQKSPPQGHIERPRLGDLDDVAFTREELVETGCAANQQAVLALFGRRTRAMRRSVDAALGQWQSQRRCTEREGHLYPPFRSLHLQPSIAGDWMLPEIVEEHPNRWDMGDWNWVVGAERVDVVVSDDTYDYTARDGAVRIVEAEAGRLVSTMALPGEPYKLLLDGNRAVVFVSVASWQQKPFEADSHPGVGTSTTVLVIDVTNREQPRIARSLALSGRLLAGRRSGRIIHAVVADGDWFPEPVLSRPEDLLPTVCREWEAEVRARFVQLAQDQERAIRAQAPTFPTLTERGSTRRLCRFLGTQIEDPRPFVTVISFDLDRDQVAPETLTVAGTAAVFVSDTALYVASRLPSVVGSWREFCLSERVVTPIHRFSLGPQPSTGRYTGTGALPWPRGKAPLMDEWCSPMRDHPSR